MWGTEASAAVRAARKRLRRSRKGSWRTDPRKNEWFRFLGHVNTQGTLEESMHPNAHGQRALAACLGLVGAAAPGRYECVQDWFGNGDPSMMRIRPAS